MDHLRCPSADVLQIRTEIPYILTSVSRSNRKIIYIRMLSYTINIQYVMSIT